MSRAGRKKYFFLLGVDIGSGAWYHTDMDTTNHEHEHFPCSCHRPEYAYTDSLCPMCEEEQEREREARRNGEYADDADANNQAFADACGSMTPEDWDADNDWLASAGWGEM